MYSKIIIDGYLSAIGIDIGGAEIAEAEYNNILGIIHNKPKAESGYDYRLRADTLEWELVELPPMPEDDEEATIEDYEAALGRFGV